MQLNFSDLPYDAFGNLALPNIFLKTMADTMICPISNYKDLKIELKYNDVSTITFSVPDRYQREPLTYYRPKDIYDPRSDNQDIKYNECYNELIGMRLIEVEFFGTFILMNPQRVDEAGVGYKNCTAYSLEYELQFRKIAPLKDTFMFYDPTGIKKNTLMDILLEYAPNWRIGKIDPDVAGRYRTLDITVDSLYSVIMNTIQQSYQCIFIFDNIYRTINVIDAQKHPLNSEVFLSTENLVKNAQLNELSEELVTSLKVYGSEDVTIRSVNPLANDNIYNIDYFIENGDVPKTLLPKWNRWRYNFQVYQPTYTQLNSELQMTDIILEAQTIHLEDLKFKVRKIENLLDVAKLERPIEGVTTPTGDIERYTKQLTDAQNEVFDYEFKLKTTSKKREEVLDNIKKITSLCQFQNYMDEVDLAQLNTFFKEDSIQDTTFVIHKTAATPTYTRSFTTTDRIFLEVDEASLKKVSGYQGFTDDEMEQLQLQGDEFDKVIEIKKSMKHYIKQNIYQLSTGKVSLYDGQNKLNIVPFKNGENLANDIGENPLMLYGSLSMSTISVSEERNEQGEYSCVCAFTVNAPKLVKKENNIVNVISEEVGTLTVIGDIKIDEDSYNINEEAGVARISFIQGLITFTATNSIYQQQATISQLYEYGVSTLNSLAYPSYEFSITVADFFNNENFMPFVDALEFGSTVNLSLPHKIFKRPILIGVVLDYTDYENFNLIFSNKFKSNQSEFILADVVGQTVSSVANLDASKFSYASFERSGIKNQIQNFLNNSFDVAKKEIINSADEGFLVDEQGVHLRKKTSDGKEIRLKHNNILITNDNWDSVKVAIGDISTPEGNKVMGVAAECLIGNLIAGERLHIQSHKVDPITGTEGDMTFKVDGSGVYLGNATITMESPSIDNSAGNKILIDPKYGFVAGNRSLFNYVGDGATVRPSFIDANGKLIRDERTGMPLNSYFYLDNNSGNAWFKGTIYADEGYFGGTISAKSIKAETISYQHLDDKLKKNLASTASTATNALLMSTNSHNLASDKARVFSQPTEPLSNRNLDTLSFSDDVLMLPEPQGYDLQDNDIWIDTKNNNKIHIYKDGRWTSTRLGSNALDIDEIFANEIFASGTIRGATLESVSTSNEAEENISIYKTATMTAGNYKTEIRWSPTDNQTNISLLDTFNTTSGWEVKQINNETDTSTLLGKTEVRGNEIKVSAENSDNIVFATNNNQVLIKQLVLAEKYITSIQPKFDIKGAFDGELRYYTYLNQVKLQGKIISSEEQSVLKIFTTLYKDILSPSSDILLPVIVKSGDNYTQQYVKYSKASGYFEFVNEITLNTNDEIHLDIMWFVENTSLSNTFNQTLLN